MCATVVAYIGTDIHVAKLQVKLMEFGVTIHNSMHRFLYKAGYISRPMGTCMCS